MPSFGRPLAPRNMLDAPGGVPPDVVVCVNKDDPRMLDYAAQQRRDWPDTWRLLLLEPGSRFAEAVRAAFQACPDDPFYGIIDDDYWPITPGWYRTMVEAAGPTGIALANRGDGVSPYGCRVMGGELARAIGSPAPGTMKHNFTDDAWAKFGEVFGLLRPLPDVLVEHRHHILRLDVPNDATYARGSADFEEDHRRYRDWLRSDEYRGQCERVAKLLGCAISTFDPAGIRLGILLPIHDMRVDYKFHGCLRMTERELAARGIRGEVLENYGGSHIGKARESVLWKAMRHDPPLTHFLFIDSDMAWDPHLPVRLLSTGHDFAAAVGVRKLDGEPSFCFNPLPNPQKVHPVTGFLAVRDIGFAFVMLKRAVIERMCEAYPDLRYNTGTEPTQHALFLDMIDKADGPYGERLSEDFSFCRRWRAIGGDIWLDPDAALGHAGRKEYTGRPRDVFQYESRQGNYVLDTTYPYR